MHRAGCVVIPSLYEPFGIVALEALAGGAPLVVARTGGLAELVDGTGAGLLFEPGNAAELAACIEMVLTDADLADEMRKHGAELLAERYSWQAIAGATAGVYAGHPSAPLSEPADRGAHGVPERGATRSDYVRAPCAPSAASR